MKRRIKIKASPNFKSGGSYGVQTPPQDATANPAVGSYNGGNDPEIKINETLQPTDRENSTLEAELGETVITDLQGEGIPEFYKIAGKRHSQGGTPLNLPPNSFIYSRDNSMKIKDPEVLKMFGKTGDKPKATTPADLSKKYNINKYRAILLDPSSDKLQVETAERMIKNYNIKLGALALAQESVKGFEDNIPAVAMPYIQTLGIDPASLVNPTPPEGLMEDAQARAFEEIPAFKTGGQVGLPKFKKGGNSKSKRRAKITKAPQYSNRTTAKQNIPKDAIIWDPSKDGYNRNKVEAGDYVKKDGRYVKVTGFSSKAYKGDFKDDRLGELQDDYGLLQDKLSDPKLRKEIVKRYRETISKVKPNAKTGLTQDDINKAAGMSDDEVISNFMRKEKQVYGLGNKHKNSGDYDPKDAWDKGATREQHDKEMKSLGFKPLTTAETTAFQAVYSDIQKMADDPKWKPDLKDFTVAQIGLGDEPGAGTGKSTISDIDGWDGNTTSGQAILAKDSKMETEKVPLIKPDEKSKITVDEYQDNKKSPWFVQDQIQLASDLGGYFGVKRDKPWRPPLTVNPANPVLQDFRGSAARIQAGAQGAMDQAKVFSGPQGFAATAGKIQANAIDGILKTQEAEYRGNQAVLNEFEKYNNNVMNQFNMKDAAWKAEGYKDQRDASRLFAADKAKAWQNVVGTLKNGITNAVKASNLNLTTPEFQLDPSSGGRINYTDTGREDLESTNQGPTEIENYQAIKHAMPNATAQEHQFVYNQQYGKPTAPSKKDANFSAMQNVRPPYENTTTARQGRGRTKKQGYRYNQNNSRR
jgi:hypothetical protein